MAGTYDVIVLGGGNAGLSSALAASETGASVVVVERAPEQTPGGNSYYTAGAFRATYDGLDDLRPLFDGLDDLTAAGVDVDSYRPADFYADMVRVTMQRTDPALAMILVEESTPAVAWLKQHGVRFGPLFARQSFKAGGRTRFWGNLVIGAEGGGAGLIAAELAATRQAGIEVRFGLRGVRLERSDGRITGVVCENETGQRELVSGRAVVIASGGFESDARMRAAHLGPGWDLAKVRGTPFNTGDGLLMAIEAGAAPRGHWSGCHAIAWDADAPAFGDPSVTNRFSRQAYPFGVVVNQEGQRFLDEGADFRNYTYAKYGAEILRQPGGRAFQLFDADSSQYISGIDYDTAGSSKVVARTIEELAGALRIDPDRLSATVAAFNRAVSDRPFDPTIRDGKGTSDLTPPKSNWALPLAAPPFTAYGVTCGITFTFGGLSVGPDGSVLRVDTTPVPGLFACGEALGGLFYHNYPGGSGLTAGTVFGRRAGTTAGRTAMAART